MEIENASTEKFTIDHNTEEKLPDHFQKCIDNVIKNEAFSRYKVISRQIPLDGGNYLAELYDINIRGQNKSGEKELNIFAKNVVPLNETMAAFMSIADVYRNESFFYKEVAKTIQRLEEDAGVPTEHRFRSVKGYSESTTEVILMENVAKKGFKTYDRLKMLPLKFFELSMQQLARLHGASFVMRERAPQLFHKIKNLKCHTTFNEHWYKFMKDLANVTYKNISDNAKEKAKNILMDVLNNFKAYLLDDSDLNILCHGDYRSNNILVREQEGEIKEVLPIDYQLIHFGNPANDILYFIYGCNDLAFRKKHGSYLINLYYDSVGDYLRYFDIDVKTVYPRKSLDESLRKGEDWGAFLAIFYYPFFFAPDDDAPSLTEGADKLEVKLDGETVRKIEEAIENRGKGMEYLFS